MANWHDRDEPAVARRTWSRSVWRVLAFVLFALFFMFLGALALSLYSEEGGRFK